MKESDKQPWYLIKYNLIMYWQYWYTSIVQYSYMILYEYCGKYSHTSIVVAKYKWFIFSRFLVICEKFHEITTLFFVNVYWKEKWKYVCNDRHFLYRNIVFLINQFGYSCILTWTFIFSDNKFCSHIYILKGCDISHNIKRVFDDEKTYACLWDNRIYIDSSLFSLVIVSGSMCMYIGTDLLL